MRTDRSHEPYQSASYAKGRQTDRSRVVMGRTRSLLRTCISNLLEMQAEVPEDVRFRELGLTSAQAVALVSELSRELGRPLALSVVWEHPTITALAKYLNASD